LLPDPPRVRRPSSSEPRSPVLHLIGNRDWVIPIECTNDGVVLKPAGQKFPLTSLTTTNDGDSPLLLAVQRLIARRQASVRAGDPPYRPQIRFLVRSDGLRTYHLAYPTLEPLQIPLTRQNIEGATP
jgi:hypothetical protein